MVEKRHTRRQALVLTCRVTDINNKGSSHGTEPLGESKSPSNLCKHLPGASGSDHPDIVAHTRVGSACPLGPATGNGRWCESTTPNCPKLVAVAPKTLGSRPLARCCGHGPHVAHMSRNTSVGSSGTSPDKSFSYLRIPGVGEARQVSGTA